MKRSIFIPLICFFALLIIVQSCSKGKSDTTTPPAPGGGNACDGVSAHFAADVEPIIQSSCATNSSCHGSGSSNGPGELLTYAQVKANATSIRSAVESKLMPKTGSLSATQIKKISCWVSNGAQND